MGGRARSAHSGPHFAGGTPSPSAAHAGYQVGPSLGWRCGAVGARSSRSPDLRYTPPPMSRRVLVTGSSGLIGSEAVAFFDARGWEVLGVDNNMRRVFFGADGDTTWNLERLRRVTKRFTHHDLDIRQRDAMLGLFAT